MTETTPAAVGSGWDFPSEQPTADQTRAEEQGVLGAMMSSSEAIGEVSQVLRADAFREPRHGAVFQATYDLFVEGTPTDVITVAAELERRGELARIGGAPYLHTCLAACPTPAMGAHYAQLVLERAVGRELGQAGTRISQFGELAGSAGDLDLARLRASVQAQVDAVFDARTTGVGYTELDAMWDEAMSDVDDVQAGRVPPGLSTGFLDLDGLTGGWKPGQMIIVAARPGLGKSALALDFARSATLRSGVTAAVFSLEMSRKELWQRFVAAEAKVRLSAITTQGGLSTRDLDAMAKARDRVRASAGTLLIDDNPSMTVATIRAKARTMARNHNLGLIVVDYLQLLSSGGRAESRQQEVSEFSRQLKLLAKELEVPLVALSQLNRGPEQRVDKRPMLGDLRESGSLEQDADIVILLSRPDAYERDDPRGGEADLIVAKHRGGPQGTITVAHQLHYARFADIAQS